MKDNLYCIITVEKLNFKFMRHKKTLDILLKQCVIVLNYKIYN